MHAVILSDPDRTWSSADVGWVSCYCTAHRSEQFARLQRGSEDRGGIPWPTTCEIRNWRIFELGDECFSRRYGTFCQESTLKGGKWKKQLCRHLLTHESSCFLTVSVATDMIENESMNKFGFFIFIVFLQKDNIIQFVCLNFSSTLMGFRIFKFASFFFSISVLLFYKL